MPIFSRIEYANECGVSKAYISVNVKRHKVVLDENGMVNTANPFNADFLEKRKNVVPKEIKVSTNKQKKKLPKKVVVHEDQAISEVDLARYNLERHAKELDIKIKEQKVVENDLKIAKLRGDVIPADLVNIVFAQHFRNVTTSFHNAADNFIAVIVAKLEGKKDEVAFIRGELIGVVNEAVKDSIAESKLSIKNIANEYADKRGKGESK